MRQTVLSVFQYQDVVIDVEKKGTRFISLQNNLPTNRCHITTNKIGIDLHVACLLSKISLGKGG